MHIYKGSVQILDSEQAVYNAKVTSSETYMNGTLCHFLVLDVYGTHKNLMKLFKRAAFRKTATISFP